MATTIEPGVADILIRSRNTVLDILEERGYNVAAYRNIAGDQILTLAGGHSRALDVIVPKIEGSAAPCERAYVVYQIQDRIRNRLATWLRDLYEVAADPAGENIVQRGDDVIVLLNEPAEHDAFTKASLQLWQKSKARLAFFHIKQVVVHPGRHILVPPHRKLSAEEAESEMRRWHLTVKSQLPLIKHSDIQARVLGLVPGDMVEVLRPSPTAGVSRVLRICAA
jgi:DNA-directed RNA polymerase subunit H (RpoH/RPB5)